MITTTHPGPVSRVVELPMTDLASDITVTRRALDEFDRPAVLVGHSYGGAVTTGAGTHPHVAHLLYLAAFQLAEGESVGRTLPDLGVPPTRLGDALRFSDDREVVTLDPGLAAELLFADVPEQIVAAAVGRLRPVRRAVFSGVPEQIGWRHRHRRTWSVPTTWWCTRIWSAPWRPGQPPGRNGPVGTAR